MKSNANKRQSLFSLCKLILLSVTLSFLSSSADAADAADAQDAKKKTSINFEDQLVEGELKKPELFYLLQKKQINFGRLIRLRENFLPEMRRSGEDLQRGSRQQ
jgi:hypothetical protein